MAEEDDTVTDVRQRILSFLKEQGQATVIELAKTLGLAPAGEKKEGVAEETVREEIRKIMERLQRMSEKKDASLNPDTAITAKLIDGLIANQERYGYWACPCRLVAGNREEDKDIICPCDYWEQDVAEFGACYCGLYVSKKVAAGEAEVGIVPERREKKGS